MMIAVILVAAMNAYSGCHTRRAPIHSSIADCTFLAIAVAKRSKACGLLGSN